jgi:hypothetical protein
MREPILCYIEGGTAYFTTQKIEDQWGDDWNDAPYEHNAGLPYEASRSRGEDWRIVKIDFESDLLTPDEGHNNSHSRLKQSTVANTHGLDHRI